jgi:predicted RecB family nuclease
MITDQSFLSFLNCPRKAYLQTASCPSERPDIEKVEAELDVLYRRRALETFLSPFRPDEVVVDPPSWAAIHLDEPRVIVNVAVASVDLQAQLHAAEQVKSRGRRRAAIYAPVLFQRANRVARSDKLLLAFQALALASAQGAIPPVAKLIHGDGKKVLKIKVQPLLGEVRRVMGRIRASQAEPRAPHVTLNSHCSACAFRAVCREEAEKTDDLSLLRGMPPKEIEKHRSRGVTAVTQFSHTYRPGRRGKRRSGKARRHDHALQALAIREQTVYVVDSPTVPHAGAALYLDVEGVPDRDFYYLLGLVAVRDGNCVAYSFWADDRAQEKANWDECSRLIEGFGDYTLYHYGRYELRFLESMKQAADAEGAATVDRIRARSFNVLAAIHSHVYFPTYSNGLKDIGNLLGAKWSAANASGIQSLAWRLAWELRRDEELKQKLLNYNREDCLALARVTEYLLSVSEGGPRPGEGGPEIASADDIRPEGGFRFGKVQFFSPDLARINKCAYSDYQREKVYVRTSRDLRQALRRIRRGEKKRVRPNLEVVCPRPEACPECRGTQIHSFAAPRSRKMVYDLRFTTSGVKRWVTCFTSPRYRCWRCLCTFLSAAYRDQDRVGHKLASWAIYHHVALRQSHVDVALSLNEIFGFSFGHSFLSRLKAQLAAKYQPVYEQLKDRLRRGSLIHSDETKVQVQRGCGYVWAFANLAEVVYVYTPTREGTVLNHMLNGFTGVLVSDFYSAYDAPNCAQQKCLVHLIRDINDDLFHHPFDEELKQIAHGLVAILRPIIDTIDRHGLKRHFLRRHQADVRRFFGPLAGGAYGSEVSRKYQRRLLKYREKLFAFLEHDGVPWNNNNAENALKRFASRRKIIGASFSEKGLRDYLVFLSIYQTCRNNGLSFLRFLQSGVFDLDALAAAGTR